MVFQSYCKFSPLTVRARMWHKRESAPVHLSRAVRDVLSNTYHDRLICKGEPTVEPSLSSDFTPLDLELWVHLKPLVCAASVDNEEAPHHLIVWICQTIRNYRRILERMSRTMYLYFIVPTVVTTNSTVTPLLSRRRIFIHWGPIRCVAIAAEKKVRYLSLVCLHAFISK
jgi:hypothetical protein